MVSTPSWRHAKESAIPYSLQQKTITFTSTTSTHQSLHYPAAQLALRFLPADRSFSAFLTPVEMPSACRAGRRTHLHALAASAATPCCLLPLPPAFLPALAAGASAGVGLAPGHAASSSCCITPGSSTVMVTTSTSWVCLMWENRCTKEPSSWRCTCRRVAAAHMAKVGGARLQMLLVVVCGLVVVVCGLVQSW
jgi:hypothetical protein